MNEVLIQVWEESEKSGKNIPTGCSLHLDEVNHKVYLESLKIDDSLSTPDSYESPVGVTVVGYVSDAIYNIVLREKTVRLQQHEMNNLIGLKEIEIEND